MASTNNFLLTKVKLTRRTRTTKEILGAKGAKKVIIMTSLQEVLMPISSKSKEKIFLKLNTLIVTGKGIILPNVFKKSI